MTTPEVLAGRYTLGDLLGHGGMSEVRRARDTVLSRDVAVKLMRPDMATESSFYERFRREAQNSASLNHPSIVAIYDTGEELTTGPDGETKLPYIVMELVEGDTVRDLIRLGGSVEQERALGIMADVAGALDFSHRKGIIHRDVKPANIMISTDGAVKVMDFGIARAVSESTTTLTQTSAVLGTAQYLSPEQARGETVDARSDVYSAGCVLYEMVTGQPPFTGESPVAVAYQHVQETPRRPSELVPGLSPYIDAVVMQAMSKNPDNRYQSASEMRGDLIAVLSGRRPDAPMLLTDSDWHEDERPEESDFPGSGSGYGRSWGPGVAAAGAAGLAAGAGLASASSAGSAGAGLGAGLGSAESPTTITGPHALTGPHAPVGAGGSATDTGSGPAGPQSIPARDGSSSDSEYQQAELEPADEQQGSRRLRALGALLLVVALLSAGVVAFNALGGDDDGEAPVAEVAEVTIPEIALRHVDEVTEQLEEMGLVVIRQNTSDPEIAEHLVISSEPIAGKRLPVGSEILLTVSSGKPILRVPNVMGMTEADARETLEEAGFTIDSESTRRPSTSDDQGKVVSTEPGPGSEVRSDTPLRLTVGTGPEEVTVPDVTGQQEEGARRALEAAGFRVSTSSVDGIAPTGQVTEQSTPGGERQLKGATITLQVSLGNRFEMPSVVGQTVPQARETLRQAGWRGRDEDVVELPQNDPDLSRVGQIHSQQPTPGVAGVNDQVVLRVYRFNLIPGPG